MYLNKKKLLKTLNLFKHLPLLNKSEPRFLQVCLYYFVKQILSHKQKNSAYFPQTFNKFTWKETKYYEFQCMDMQTF